MGRTILHKCQLFLRECLEKQKRDVYLNIRNAQTHNNMTTFIHSTFRCNLYDYNSTRSSIMIENADLKECADYSGISLEVLDHCAQKMAKSYNRTNEPKSRDFIANGYKVTLYVG